MLEKNFQSELRRWLNHNLHFTFAYEIKFCKTTTLPFAAFEPQQIPSLLAAKHGAAGLAYKIPDDTRSTKPFDGFKLFKCPAFVILRFYKRGSKEFIIIDVEEFQKEIDTCGRKSITEVRAKEIGKVYELGKIYAV